MTYEDVKSIRQNPTVQDVDNQELSKMIDDAIEKQIPKRPFLVEPREGYVVAVVCPNCHCDSFGDNKDKYCINCGQALDWGEENETINR